MTEERKIQLVAEVDATRTREGFNEIGQQAGVMASTVTRAGEQAGRAVDSIGNGAAASSSKVEAAQRNLIGSIQRTTAQMEAGSRTSARYYEVLAQQRGVDPAALAPFLAQLRQVEAAQLRVNAAVSDTVPNLRNVGVSAAQTAAALRGVPAQFTDIITSLQGGQAPLTVLIQQGGQLADMFGGAGQAAQALGNYVRGLITPYSVAAVAAVALAVAYHTGSMEADAYARALELTGNAAGGTVDQLTDMAREIGRISGSQGKAAEAVAAIAGTGQVSADNLQRFATAAVEAQKVIGRSVADTAADFASLKDAPLSALEKINDKYHFITSATYAQVKALQDQGRASEAAAVAQNAYADAVINQKDKVMSSLSDWERGWIRIKGGISGAVDAVLNFGRASTNTEKIASLLNSRETMEANMARAREQRDTKAEAAWQLQLDRNRNEINGLRAKTDAEREAAKAAADAADLTEARNKWLAEGDKYLDREARLRREITKAENEGAAAGMSAEAIRTRIAAIRNSNKEAVVDGIDAQIEAEKRQDAVAEVIARRELARIAARRAAGSMGEDETISAVAAAEMAALGREQSSLERQLVLAGKQKNSLREQAALRGQIAVVNERYASRELQLGDDLFAAEQRRSRLAADNYAKVIDSAGAARDGLVSQVRAQQDANEQIGLEADSIALLVAARLESLAARKDEDAEIAEGLDLSGRLSEEYRAQAAALRDLAAAKRDEGSRKAAQEAREEWKKTAESIGDALSDNIMRGGKSAAQYVKDLFRTMILRPVISAIAGPVAGALGMGASGTASAAAVGGGSGMLGTVGSALGLSGAMSALSAGASYGAAGLFAGSGVGTMLSAGGSMIGAGSIMSGIGTIVGALGPIALGIGAAVAIWKKFDTGGTNHSGGAATASSAGVRAFDSSPIGFHLPERNAAADQMTAALAGGIVSILDSTALAFGKTAGYTAATAFADDSSRDGAWGALLINKLGEKVVNWQDTQTSRWAPKEFADGEAGQKQYLAALSSSVRTALDGIGMPAWAKTMLDGLGKEASIEDLAKVADAINTTQRALVIMGNSLTGFSQLGDKATSALIAASGGIEALASGASAYYDAFYSEGEKSASTIKQIKDALAAVNITMPATQAAYRAQVEAQMALGEAGAPAVAVLLKVAGAFAQVTPQMEAAADAARSAADVLGERMDLQKQLDELTLSSTQLLTKQRMALDASNRGLFDQIQAAQKAKEAQDAARSSLDDFLGQMKSFADTTKGLNGSLLTGSMSTLTPEQQYAETSRQLDQTLAAIRAGDTSAQGNLKSVEDAFLAASMKSNSGDSMYASDFARVLKVNDEISQWASGQIDTAQASLDALNAQVIGINDLNASMLGVADAINGLPAAFGATPPAVSMPAPVLNYSTMGTANTEALVAEVKALRTELLAEIKGRREDARQQTGDIIVSHDAASALAAEAIVAGAKDAAVEGNWVADKPSRRRPSV